MLKHLVSLILLGTALVAPAAPALAAKPDRGNIVQVARSAGTFTTLVKALEAAGLVGTLSGEGHGTFTVFAPNDAAFAKLPAGTLDALLRDPVALKKILLFHVVPGTYRAADVVAAGTLSSAIGQPLVVGAEGGPSVNGSRIIATDIEARNGVIHVIDTVMIPR